MLKIDTYKIVIFHIDRSKYTFYTDEFILKNIRSFHRFMCSFSARNDVTTKNFQFTANIQRKK